MKNMVLMTDYSEIIKAVPEMKDKMKYYPEPFVFLVDGVLTTFGEIRITKDDVCIKMLESNEKGKGYGKEFINFLKLMPEKTEIWGESIVSAVPFWSKMGAEFNETLYRQYKEAMKNNEELEEDFLIPFIIHC